MTDMRGKGRFSSQGLAQGLAQGGPQIADEEMKEARPKADLGEMTCICFSRLSLSRGSCFIFISESQGLPWWLRR